MMPWQGQKDNLIDRFDGRAHLDIISDAREKVDDPEVLEGCSKKEARQLNYERYRILIQNDFLKGKMKKRS